MRTSMIAVLVAACSLGAPAALLPNFGVAPVLVPGSAWDGTLTSPGRVVPVPQMYGNGQVLTGAALANWTGWIQSPVSQLDTAPMISVERSDFQITMGAPHHGDSAGILGLYVTITGSARIFIPWQSVNVMTTSQGYSFIVQARPDLEGDAWIDCELVPVNGLSFVQSIPLTLRTNSLGANRPKFYIDAVSGTDDLTTNGGVIRGRGPGTNAWRTEMFAEVNATAGSVVLFATGQIYSLNTDPTAVNDARQRIDFRPIDGSGRATFTRDLRHAYSPRVTGTEVVPPGFAMAQKVRLLGYTNIDFNAYKIPGMLRVGSTNLPLTDGLIPGNTCYSNCTFVDPNGCAGPAVPMISSDGTHMGEAQPLTGVNITGSAYFNGAGGHYIMDSSGSLLICSGAKFQRNVTWEVAGDSAYLQSLDGYASFNVKINQTKAPWLRLHSDPYLVVDTATYDGPSATTRINWVTTSGYVLSFSQLYSSDIHFTVNDDGSASKMATLDIKTGLPLALDQYNTGSETSAAGVLPYQDSSRPGDYRWTAHFGANGPTPAYTALPGDWTQANGSVPGRYIRAGDHAIVMQKIHPDSFQTIVNSPSALPIKNCYTQRQIVRGADIQDVFADGNQYNSTGGCDVSVDGKTFKSTSMLVSSAVAFDGTSTVLNIDGAPFVNASYNSTSGLVVGTLKTGVSLVFGQGTANAPGATKNVTFSAPYTVNCANHGLKVGAPLTFLPGAAFTSNDMPSYLRSGGTFYVKTVATDGNSFTISSTSGGGITSLSSYTVGVIGRFIVMPFPVSSIVCGSVNFTTSGPGDGVSVKSSQIVQISGGGVVHYTIGYNDLLNNKITTPRYPYKTGDTSIPNAVLSGNSTQATVTITLNSGTATIVMVGDMDLIVDSGAPTISVANGKTATSIGNAVKGSISPTKVTVFGDASNVTSGVDTAQFTHLMLSDDIYENSTKTDYAQILSADILPAFADLGPTAPSVSGVFSKPFASMAGKLDQPCVQVKALKNVAWVNCVWEHIGPDQLKYPLYNKFDQTTWFAYETMNVGNNPFNVSLASGQINVGMTRCQVNTTMPLSYWYWRSGVTPFDCVFVDCLFSQYATQPIGVTFDNCQAVQQNAGYPDSSRVKPIKIDPVTLKPIDVADLLFKARVANNNNPNVWFDIDNLPIRPGVSMIGAYRIAA